MNEGFLKVIFNIHPTFIMMVSMRTPTLHNLLIQGIGYKNYFENYGFFRTVFMLWYLGFLYLFRSAKFWYWNGTY